MRPVLRRLEENNIIKSRIIGPKRLREWTLTKSFEAKLMNYKSIFHMPWIQKIEERRKASVGFCQKCGFEHPYPKKLGFHEKKVKDDEVRSPKRYI